jgi:hypothetical protein
MNKIAMHVKEVSADFVQLGCSCIYNIRATTEWGYLQLQEPHAVQNFNKMLEKSLPR